MRRSYLARFKWALIPKPFQSRIFVKIPAGFEVLRLVQAAQRDIDIFFIVANDTADGRATVFAEVAITFAG